jgi:cell division protease FtsH
MAKRTSRQSPEDQNILDKLRSSFGSIPPKGDPGRRKFHFSFWYFLMALLALSFVHDYFMARQVNTIPYSEFKRYVAEGKVQKLSLKPQQITGTLTQDEQGDKDKQFVTVRVDDPELVKRVYSTPRNFENFCSNSSAYRPEVNQKSNEASTR